MDGLLGVAGMIITSDDWDHSLKFHAFSTAPVSFSQHMAYDYGKYHIMPSMVHLWLIYASKFLSTIHWSR
jgi:hypothetical protein